MLVTAVKVAENSGTMDVAIVGKPSDKESGAFDYRIYDINAGRDNGKSVREVRGNPLRILEHLCFLSKLGSIYYLVEPIAFERANYESKGAFAKLLVRMRHQARGKVIALSLLLSIVATILSVIATGLQIAERF